MFSVVFVFLPAWRHSDSVVHCVSWLSLTDNISIRSKPYRSQEVRCWFSPLKTATLIGPIETCELIPTNHCVHRPFGRILIPLTRRNGGVMKWRCPVPNINALTVAEVGIVMPWITAYYVQPFRFLSISNNPSSGIDADAAAGIINATSVILLLAHGRWHAS